MKLKNITSLDELEVGMKVYGEYGEKTVLEKLNNTVMLSASNDFAQIDSWFNIYGLMRNKYQIEGVKLELKDGETYYYPLIDSLQLYASGSWDGFNTDRHRIKYGLVFRTKEEALKRREEILKMLEQ